MAGETGGSSKVLMILEVIFSLVMLSMIMGVTYPLYVMTDRQRPVLKYDESSGYISVATLALISATVYSILTILNCAKKIISGESKILAATLVTSLLFFGTCDVMNAIRYQNRIADNEDKFGGHGEPNSRSNTVAAFMVFEFVVAVVLLILAVAAELSGTGNTGHAAPPGERDEIEVPPKADQNA